MNSNLLKKTIAPSVAKTELFLIACLLSLGGSLAYSSDKTTPSDLPLRGAATIDTCFSPIEECDQKLLNFMQGATHSIDVAIFDFDVAILTDYLIESHSKIEIRVLVDKRQSKRAGSGVSKLVAAGVNVRYGKQKGSGIMHNKFTIIDGKALETGSFNYTNHATTVNNENQLYIWDQDTVAKFSGRFDDIWQEGVQVPVETELNK